MSVRFRSAIGLAAIAALAAGCFPAVPPADPYAPPPSPLAGTNWVLDSATNSPTQTQPAKPAPAASTTTTSGGQKAAITQASTPGPIQAAWLLPDRGSHPSLSFSADRNAASGSTGCNRYFGNFSAGPNNLWFGDLATTKMMCFDTLAVQEIAYLDALAKVNGYTNDGTTLILHTTDGRHLAFSPLTTPVGARAASYKYVCDDGLYFTANFDPAAQSAAIQVSTGATDTLKQEAAGASVTYSSPRHRLNATDNEALLNTLYDGATHHCVAPLAPQG
ncbi:MAG TPA: META domain-containing protein [Dongiaceae bacterium]|jgi:heat shock protein HslJ|nr:META domain-containing protein [Dongiaceae bacterium]